MAVGGATGAEGPGFGGPGVSGGAPGLPGASGPSTGGIAGAPGSGGGVPGTGVPSVPGGSATPGSFGAGASGFMSAFTGKSDPNAMTAFPQTSSYGKGAQAGHALGLIGSALTAFMGPTSVLGFAQSAYGIYGHARGLARGGIYSGGFADTAPGDMGMGGGPDITESPTPKKPTPAPRPAPEPAPAPKVTPYTETKEYLGGQERLRSLQGEINRLGAELEAIQAKRKALEPKRRKMVGRIPLVHTELGGAEPKALTPEKRERMLMSHSIPKNARRRGGA